MPAPARAAAFRVLREVATRPVDLGDALARGRDPLEDPRDRALATELATGTLRWRNAVDYQLQRFSARPLDKLDPAVLDALRLGAYQILYLDRVPVSAVVNDTVDLVKRAGFRSAAGFVNAVLRRLARERGALVWPDRSQNLVDHLAVVHSHPAWLVARWVARYGEEAAEAWLRFNNVPPPLTLAPNRQRTSRDTLAERLRAEQVETIPTPVAPHGLFVTKGRALTSAAFREGFCLVQDEASQVIPELVGARPGQRALDACAAPGGKTVALAAQCAPGGMVVATDVRWRRVQVLAATLARCRVENASVVHVSESGPFPFREAVFDRVLVDAPCSGLGTIRRDPDIRWRRAPADFDAFTRVQRELLHRTAVLVSPGGWLVYSTCSSEPEENEEVVAAFLERHADFDVVPLKSLGLSDAIAAMETPQGYFRSSPLEGLEAFFGAVLVRRRGMAL